MVYNGGNGFSKCGAIITLLDTQPQTLTLILYNVHLQTMQLTNWIL